MRLVANGDSFTYGFGLSGKGTDPEQWPDGWDDKQHALLHSWPKILADRLRMPCHNLSRPGGSNDRIMRTTLQHFAEVGYADTLLIVGWTHPLRREVHVIDDIRQRFPNERPNGYKAFLPCSNDDDVEPSTQWADEFRKHGWDEIESHVRFFQQVILLQSYCALRQIPHLSFCVTTPHKWMRRQIHAGNQYAMDMALALHDSVDWSRFVTGIHILEILEPVAGSMDSTRHPTLLGHTAITETLIAELLARKMIDAQCWIDTSR